MDLVKGQPYFFIGAAVGLDIDEIMSIAISAAILTGTDIAIGFLRLSL